MNAQVARDEGLAEAETQTPRDALPILTLGALFILAIPSRYTLGPLGGAGAPATLLGLVALGGWFFLHVSRPFPRTVVRQPFRAALLFFLGAVVASFVVVAARPGGSSETWSSIFAIVVLTSWVGIALYATDFLLGWSSLSMLVARLSTMAGFYALLGIFQYFTTLPLTNYFAFLPGLTLNQALVSISTRDGLNRPASTAIHAIEFGVVLTALLPLCLHVMLHGKELPRWRRLFPALAVVAAIPLCISRSAIICGAVAVFALLPTWSPRARARGFAALGVGTVALFVLAPGVLGTLQGLFVNISNDSSASSRTDSYGIAWDFIERHPVTGRGYGTFLPSYRILDNQYLLSMIEIGLLGVGALLLVFLTALGCAAVTRRHSSDPRRRDLMQSLFASILSVAVGFAFFDALSFPQYAATSFLLLGINGAAWRLSRVEARTNGSTEGPGVAQGPGGQGGCEVVPEPPQRGGRHGPREPLDRPREEASSPSRRRPPRGPADVGTGAPG